MLPHALLYIKHYILPLLLLLPIASFAQSYRKEIRHNIVVSVQGGEANSLSKPQNGISLKDKAGAGAGLDLTYEIDYRRFFFNVGVTSDYKYLRQWLEGKTETDSRITIDCDADPVEYQYVYSDWNDRQQIIDVGLKVSFGYRFHPYVYGAIGAKMLFPMFSDYTVNTRLYTQGIYNFMSEPMRSFPEKGIDVTNYGYYAEQDFNYSATNTNALSYAINNIAITAELGGIIPLSAKYVQMRAGLFAEYSLPIADYQKKPMLGNYEYINSNPNSLTETDMKQNLMLNSVLDADVMQRISHRLALGVRISFIFDVTREKIPCRCEMNY